MDDTIIESSSSAAVSVLVQHYVEEVGEPDHLIAAEMSR